MEGFQEISYTHRPMQNRCLFTGAGMVGNRRGEHVIPRWMVRDHGIGDGEVELGSGAAAAAVGQFTAPALPEANQAFGKLENRIKEDQAAVGDDEMHLWLMKIMAGMLWNHCRLAANSRHPKAPAPFDERLAGILAEAFHAGFAAWSAGTYVRQGSLVRLPAATRPLFLVNAFGAVTNTGYSDTHDAILPYLMIAFGRPAHGVVVASFFEEQRALEDAAILEAWKASPVKDARDSLPVRAALSLMFHERVVRPRYEKMTGRVTPDALIDQVACSLGVEFFVDADGARRFRNRSGPWDDAPEA